MKKSEFKTHLTQKCPGLSAAQVKSALRVTFEQLEYALGTGRRVEIRGFGSFNLRVREARLGRNPKTGKTVTLPRKAIPHFKPGKSLKKLVDQSKKATRKVAVHRAD